MATEKVISTDELMTAILKLLEKYHADNALLFGSYARGEATPDSDIDLIVYGGERFYPADIFAFAEDLFELTEKRVDVYEIHEIDDTSLFYKEIMKDVVMVA